MSAPPAQEGPRLSAGFLGALPLFAAYELGLLAQPATAARASAELLVGRALFLFGGRLQLARVALLCLAAALAFVRVRRAGVPVARTVLRPVALGLAAGILLGPLLLVLQDWLGAGAVGLGRPEPRGLAALLRLLGAAPWEELLFRVALYGSLYLAARRLVLFLGLHSAAARYGAELAALLGSSVLFAAFHLGSVQDWLGASGEPYDAGRFAWRVSAGILLGGLFRWLGFGAAAWAHAVFNLGLALGVGPG